MIELRGVGHSYGRKRVLDDVSFTVAPGTVMGLVGPNSAGKTTLMRGVVSLLTPAEGTVRVAGHDARTAAAAIRRSVGYLPEQTGLYAELLTWEYLDLFAEIAGHSPGERARRVAAALDRSGLTDRRALPVGALSKGMRQRLALAGALMHDPAVLVLDEPTDGLDPHSRELFLADVRALADGGAAVLLSSHVLAEVEAVSDDVVILVGGKTVVEKADESTRFMVEVRGDAEQARRVLNGAPEVTAVSLGQADRTLLVEPASGAPDAADIVALLVRAHIAVVEVRRARDNLRSRFLRAVDRQGDPS